MGKYLEAMLRGPAPRGPSQRKGELAQHTRPGRRTGAGGRSRLPAAFDPVAPVADRVAALGNPRVILKREILATDCAERDVGVQAYFLGLVRKAVHERFVGDLQRPTHCVLADTIFDLEVSPDGSKLASAGADRLARVWDLKERRLIVSLEGHADYVTAVAFRKDKEQL